MTVDIRHSTPRWELTRNPDVAERGARQTLSGLYTSWLIDDLTKARFAYEPILRLDATDKKAATDFLHTLIDGETPRGRYRLDRDIWDVINGVARDLFFAGESIAELYTATRDTTTPEGDGKNSQIAILPSWTLQRRRKRIRQITIDGDWKDITDATLITIRLPKALARNVRTARTHLAIVDRHHRDRMRFLERRVDEYDPTVHDRTVNELSARATAGIGWDGRGLFVERATNSYRLHRELQFRILWRHIVDVALEGLAEACRLSNDPAAPTGIHLDGIPTLADLEEASKEVLAGPESLDKIRYRVLMPRYARRG